MHGPAATAKEVSRGVGSAAIMKSRQALVAALAFCSTMSSAAEGPPDAAVQQVFTQTVEQAKGPVQVRVGQTCDKPKVRRFSVLKRGEMKNSGDIPQGYYPMTAQVELQCGSSPQVQRWNGELELQVYQNALQAWSVRW